MAKDTHRPFGTRLTVPYGAKILDLEIIAENAEGQRVASHRATPVVEPDPGTVLQGRVLDGEGRAVANARVQVLLRGFEAEFFCLEDPQGSLEMPADRVADAGRWVCAINFRNPENRWSDDGLGAGRPSDLGARYQGLFEVLEPGEYEFVLGADDAARVQFDGRPVVEAEGSGHFREARSIVHLEPGVALLDISFYQSVGASEVQLRVRRPNALDPQVLETSLLVPAESDWAAETDSEGFFSIDGVPTILGEIWVRSDTPEGGEPLLGVVLPVRSGVTDLGTLTPSQVSWSPRGPKEPERDR